MDFENILDEVEEQINRINNEMNIYELSHEENIFTYNSLITILLELKKIK